MILLTRYQGPTNVRGERILIHCPSTNLKQTFPYNHNCRTDLETHFDAVTKFCHEHGFFGNFRATNAPKPYSFAFMSVERSVHFEIIDNI